MNISVSTFSKPLLLGTLALGILVNGCGGGSTVGNSPAPTASPSPTTSPTPTASPSPPSPTASPAAAGELKVERAVLARSEGTPGPNGQPKLKLAENNVFKRGESIYLVLVNVGKFKKGNDGKHQIDMDVEVSNASGKILLSRKNLLKNSGIMLLPNDVAQTPYGNVDTKTTTQAGNYVMTVTIYDKIGNAKVTRSAEFKLE